MNIEYVDINEVKPYKKNAKKHPKEQVEKIAQSIKEFGWQQPVVVDKDNVIVIGHGRHKAAQILGEKQIPVVRADDLTEEQIKALRLADNKVAESGIDQKALEFELNSIFEIDMSQFGFVYKDEEQEPEPEVEFTEELMLTHNYIVLYFDNDFDWEVAKDKFGLKEVKDLIPRKSQPTGIGRVINGKEILKWQS